LNEAKPLIFLDYDSVQNPIIEIQTQRSALKLIYDQAIYIGRYLKELGACKIIVEQNYFDRDYLEEYSAFYSKSTRGYGNTCRRVHFFQNEEVDHGLFSKALCGDPDAIEALKSSYLGFTILRPIPEAQFGRTVLKWYEDKLTPPRIIEPARMYRCNIANLVLEVEGIAWQQQDTAIAACATIGIWSMLHSSALSERHSIPTTTEITEAANQTDTVGVSTFPSRGLSPLQILQSIKQLGFSPTYVQGGLLDFHFTKSAFASISASFIRSGYPILLLGRYKTSTTIGHAICAVGFRDAVVPSSLDHSKIYLQDEYVDVIYAHDDNVGPNVRMEISSDTIEVRPGVPVDVCVLKMKAPDYIDLSDKMGPLDNKEFVPTGIVAALNKDLRICPVRLMQDAIPTVGDILYSLNRVRNLNKLNALSLLHSTRFVQLTDYMSKDLETLLTNNQTLLGNVREKILQELPPMSFHVAVLRIASASPSGNVLIDLLYDTTDSDRNRPVFGHIVYDQQVKFALDNIVKTHYGNDGFELRYGKPIIAY